MIVGARKGGLSISEIADLGFSCTIVSRACRQLCKKLKTSSEQQFWRAMREVRTEGSDWSKLTGR